MQEVVAPISHIKFDMETSIEQQVGVQPLPFTGMDKSGASICHFFKLNVCGRGVNCPFRHVLGDKSVVCKHWLRGLCKKGDQCEFLHEYDMSKMPECYFYAKFGRCDNKDCQYQHIDPASKIKDCPWYDRGFCKHGPHCKHRHRRKVMCSNYLVGFCPVGKYCKFAHPPWDLPVGDKGSKCNFCGEMGHKSPYCRINPLRVNNQIQMDTGTSTNGLVIKIPSGSDSLKPQFSTSSSTLLSVNQLQTTIMNKAATMPSFNQFAHVTCFKCGNKGHYANRCTESRMNFQQMLRPT